ncbi:MAG: carbohydrate ABC transporter permease [Bacteroidetes bacterium]|nr:carbohydrate ABC transporter permease [Bacteroidota bacterium]
MRNRRPLGVTMALWIGIIVVMTPFGVLLLASLKQDTELVGGALSLPQQLMWSNYVTVWIEARFSSYLVNSVIVATVTTIVVVLISAMAGFSFAKLKFRGRNALFTILLLGLMLPTTAIIIPIYYRLRDLHLLDSLAGVVLPLIGLGLPFGTFLMRQFFRDVPDSLMDSAIIDGCGRLRAFISIFLPLASGGLQALAVVQFMYAWREYLLPLIVSQSDETQTLTVGLYRLYKSYVSSYTKIAAGAVIVFVPILIVYALMQRHFATGMLAGSVKG